MSILPAAKSIRGFFGFLASETAALFSSVTFLCLFLVTLHLSFSLPLLFRPMDTEVDAYGRYASAVYDAKQNNPFPLNGSVWLPLYPTLLYPIIYQFPNSTFAPRLEVTLLSCFIPVFLFLITKKLVKQTSFAFITSLLYVCLSLFTEISATTLTEPLFLSFFLASLYCFLTQRWKLWIVLMIACQALRFEAWFVIPLFIYAIFQQPTVTNKNKFIFTFLLCIFPAIHSSAGLEFAGNASSYYKQMTDMTKNVFMPGMWNWPEATKAWLELVPKVIPTSYLFFAATGFYYLLRERQSSETITDHKEAVLLFLVLPLLLSLMLPIQVFLHLRDWLPVRYLLIPVTLAFPLCGLGLQFLAQKFSLKIHLAVYVILALLMFFELWSLKINTHRLLSTYSAEDFAYLTSEITTLRTLVDITNDTRIIILDPVRVKERPLLESFFMIWFFMPQRPVVIETTTEKYKPLFDEPETPEIVVIGNGQKLPSQYQFEPIRTDSGYQYFKVNKTATPAANL